MLKWKAILKRQTLNRFVLRYDYLHSGLYGVDLGPAIYLGLCVFWYVNLGNLKAVFVGSKTKSTRKRSCRLMAVGS